MTAARASHGRTGPRRGRSAARLAAVQAIYQIEMANLSAENVLEEFESHRLGSDEGAGSYAGVDRDFFSDVVRGAAARRQDIDAMIAPLLGAGWSLSRLDRVLHAILRAGTYEIVARPDVPPAVAISEYVDVAHEFFEGTEPAFINAILDRLARQRRPGEMKGVARESATDQG